MRAPRPTKTILNRVLKGQSRPGFPRCSPSSSASARGARARARSTALRVGELCPSTSSTRPARPGVLVYRPPSTAVARPGRLPLLAPSLVATRSAARWSLPFVPCVSLAALSETVRSAMRLCFAHADAACPLLRGQSAGGHLSMEMGLTTGRARGRPGGGGGRAVSERPTTVPLAQTSLNENLRSTPTRYGRVAALPRGATSAACWSAGAD